MLRFDANVAEYLDWPPAFHYRSDNVAADITVGEKRLMGDTVVGNYPPRTALGHRLIALRRAHVLGDGTLLGWDEIDQEVRARRGGRSDA